MAKVTGIFKVHGTINGVTFYTMEGKSIAKKERSISVKKFKNAPNYASFRDAGKEMGTSSKMSKTFREPLLLFTKNIAEPRMYSRLNGLFRKMTLLDPISRRGERTVGNGVATADGKRLLHDFEFNKYLGLRNVLFSDFVFDAVLQRLTITDFVPKKNMKVAQGTTHVSFVLLRYDFDFISTASAVSAGTPVSVSLKAASQDLVLDCPVLVESIGTKHFLLQIQSYQEVNGVMNAMMGEDNGVLSFIAI